MANAQPNGMAPTIRATVGRDALIPPDLRRRMVPRNGQDRSLQMGQGARPTGKTTVPTAPQTYVGDDACIVPGTLRGANVRGRDKSRPYE